MGKKVIMQPFVAYELVGTGKTVVQRFDSTKPFAEFKSQVTQSLGLDTLNSAGSDAVVLKSVREGGKEVEIYDEYDFEGLKARATAVAAKNDGSSLLIRVQSTQPVASSSKSPFEASSAAQPVSAKANGKRRASDASPSPTPALLTTPPTASVKKSRKKKPASTPDVALSVPLAQSPTPPTPSPASTKRAREPSPPSLGSPATDESPSAKKRKVMALPLPPSARKSNLYKPLRPSPLGQQIGEDHEREEVLRQKAEKRRRRKSKALSSGPSSRGTSPQPQSESPVLAPNAAVEVSSMPETSPVPTNLAADASRAEKTGKKSRRKTKASAAPTDLTPITGTAPTPAEKPEASTSQASSVVETPAPAAASTTAEMTPSKVRKSSKAEKTASKTPKGPGLALSIMAAHRERMRLEKEAKEQASTTASPSSTTSVVGSEVAAAVSDAEMGSPAALAEFVPTVDAAASEDDGEEPPSSSAAKKRRKSKKSEATAIEPDAEDQSSVTAPTTPAATPGVTALPESGRQTVSAKKARKSLLVASPASQEATAEERVGCLLCGQKTLHLQKDCPVVLQGVASVANALLEKREMASERPNDLNLRKAIEALLSWQDRLARRDRHPAATISPANASTVNKTTDTASTPGEATAAEDEIPATTPRRSVTPSPTSMKTANADASPERPDSQPPSPPTAIPAPIGLPYPARSVLLSKQSTPSKSSRSGISQSDVVFQTADEDSSSSDSDEESDDNASDSASTASGSSSSSSRSGSGVTSEEETEAAPPPPEDPEELMRHFFGAPLSQQMKKKARLSGISHDVARLPSKSPEDASGDEAEEHDRTRRHESLSSVDGTDEDENNASADERVGGATPMASLNSTSVSQDQISSPIATSSRSASPSAEIPSASTIQSPEAQPQMVEDKRQSFAEMAIPSPTVAVDGDQAMVEAMAEDDGPDAWAAVPTQPDKFRSPAEHITVNSLPSPPLSPSSSQVQAAELTLSQAADGDVPMASPSPEKTSPQWQISPQKAPAKLMEPVEAAVPVVRRSTRSASRDPVVSRATRSTSKEPLTGTAPPLRSRRLRSASQEFPASLPASPARAIRTSGRTTRSQEVLEAPSSLSRPAKATKGKKESAVVAETQSSQPLRRSSRRASTLEPVETSSQIDELATSEPPSAPPNGNSRFPSPVMEDAEENEDDKAPAGTQFTQYQSPPLEDTGNPLFLSLGSHPQQTQHYTAHPDASSSFKEDAPLPNGQVSRTSSPQRLTPIEHEADAEVIEEDEDEDEVYGSAAEHLISPTASKRSFVRGRSSLNVSGLVDKSEDESDGNAPSSDDESPVKTTVQTDRTPRREFNSQPLPAKTNGLFSSHIPTLSSLSSELLRMGRNAIGSSPRPSVSASQPNTPSILPAGEDDSSEESDSSAEGAVPSALASRVAGAAKKPRKSMRDSMGW